MGAAVQLAPRLAEDLGLEPDERGNPLPRPRDDRRIIGAARGGELFGTGADLVEVGTRREREASDRVEGAQRG